MKQTSAPHIPYINHVRGMVPYRSPIGNALRAAKIRRNKSIFRRIGKWMGQRAIDEDCFRSADIVVAIPSPWQRKLWRGFNPAAVLAHEVAAALKLPNQQPLNITPGPRQAKLDRRQRQANLQKRIRSRSVPHASILLVDDVTTTGSTAQAYTQELLGAGASSVSLFVACVTHSPNKNLQSICAYPME